MVAPRAGAFTQPFLAGSEGMGSGCCARARAGFGASGDGRGAARLSVDGLAKSRPKLRCVVRHPEIRFSTSASRPSHGAKARPYRVGAPKRALSCHPCRWKPSSVARRSGRRPWQGRVRTAPAVPGPRREGSEPPTPPTRPLSDATGRQRTMANPLLRVPLPRLSPEKARRPDVHVDVQVPLALLHERRGPRGRVDFIPRRHGE